MEYARNRGGGSSSVFSRRPDEGAQGRRRRAAARGRRTRGQLSRRLRAASAVPASSPASCLRRWRGRSSSPTAVASRAGRPSAPPIPSLMAAARSFLAAAPLPAAAHPPFPSSPAASFARICGSPPSSVRVELPPAPPALALLHGHDPQICLRHGGGGAGLRGRHTAAGVELGAPQAGGWRCAAGRREAGRGTNTHAGPALLLPRHPSPQVAAAAACAQAEARCRGRTGRERKRESA